MINSAASRLSWSSAAQTSIFGGSSLSFLSFSKIRKTPSSFSPSRAAAYHQKADQDRVTHAYTIGQEMTVSESTVKASLINVGMMKAKLSLKGILNQWHLNCLCWDRFQKSRTLSNMLGRISHSSDFLSRVNNTICRDIFIHWQSLLSSLPPLTHIMYTLISICPRSSSYGTFAELARNTLSGRWCRCCCRPVYQTRNWKMI